MGTVYYIEIMQESFNYEMFNYRKFRGQEFYFLTNSKEAFKKL